MSGKIFSVEMRPVPVQKSNNQTFGATFARLAQSGILALALALEPALHGQATPGGAASNAPPEAADLSLDQLINIHVTSVARKDTSIENSPAAVSVVTADDISRLGITSLPDALRLVPGMDVAQIAANQWAVSVRGFNAQFDGNLLVMIDGRSVYTASSGGVFWNAQSVMMDDIDRIEVIRGPGGTMWGANAVNGVINIVSKSARETQGLLLTAAGGTELQPLAGVRYGGVLASNLYYRVYAQQSDFAQFTENTGHGAGDYWNTSLAGFRVDWEPPTQNTLTVQGETYYDDAGDPSRRISLAPPGTAYFSDVAHNTGGNLLGRWTHDFSPTSQLTVQGYYDHVEQDDNFGELYQETYDFDLKQHFALGSWNDFVTGGGYRYATVRNTPSPELIWSPETSCITIYNAFIQDEISIVPDRLRLTLGGKAQYDSQVDWEPQLDGRLLWTPTARQSIWAAVSEATASPPLFRADGRLNVDAFQPSGGGPPALVSLLGDPNIGMGRLDNYETGYRITPVDRLSFDATLFHNEYANLIVPVANPPRMEATPAPPHLLLSSTYESIASARTDGFELSSQWRVTDNWRVGANYSLLKTHLGDNAMLLGRSPQQQAQITSYLDILPNLQLNGAFYFVDQCTSPMAASVVQIPSYGRLDVGLVWHPTRALEIGIWGGNLLQREHLEFASQQTPALTEVPRSIMAKITLRF